MERGVKQMNPEFKINIYNWLFVICGMGTAWLMIYLINIAPTKVHIIILMLAFIPLVGSLFAVLARREVYKVDCIPKRIITAIRLGDITKRIELFRGRMV